MILYTYNHPDGHDPFFASKEAAIASARETVKGEDWMFGPIEVERHEIVPMTRANVMAILSSSGGQWSLSCEIVATIEPK